MRLNYNLLNLQLVTQEINTKVCLFSEVNTKVCLLSFLARKCVFLIQSLVRGTEVCLFDFYARKCVLSDSLF